MSEAKRANELNKKQQQKFTQINILHKLRKKKVAEKCEREPANGN